ncbi:MAG: LacI family DNA-binding transcriptional regulator [Peptostreptococcaceae bacterium]
MVTIKEIAEKSGFSQSTVSRLLNNDSSLSVSSKTKNKILNTALSLGYERKYIKAIIEKIALLFWITGSEELEDVYFKEMRLQIEKYACDKNMELVVVKEEEGIDKIPNDISGFIAVGGFSDEEISKLYQITQNGVFIDSNPNPDLFDSIQPNTPRIAQKAINYFLESGHSNIGFIGGTYYNPNTRSHEKDIREITFREELSKINLLNENNIFICEKFSVTNGYNIGLEAITKLKDDLPTAFFVASDALAIGVLQALNEKNISIPTRVSIISINNIDIAKYVSPPLSTFHIDIPELCKTAISLLSEQIIDERAYKKTVLLNSELVIRKSFCP